MARVLGVAEAEIDAEMPFVEQGLDSLGGLRLLDALAAELGHALDAALLYDHPTPSALAVALLAAFRRRSQNRPNRRCRRR